MTDSSKTSSLDAGRDARNSATAAADAPRALDFQAAGGPLCSRMAEGLIGSEILRIAAEIRAMKAQGANVLDLTVGDFAADQFRIPPKELEEVLPQQLLVLKAAAAALANGGWNEALLLRTGVFIGLGLDLNTTNFHLRWVMLDKARAWARQRGLTPAQIDTWAAQLRDAAGPPLTANRTMGALASVAASRIVFQSLCRS